jgi:glycosyltransferase involved in cell wall biosynthesis
MKKIAILINSLTSGGAEKQASLLAKGLSVKYKVLFIIFDGENINQRFYAFINNNSNIDIRILNDNKLGILTKVYSIYKTEKPDIAFSYLPLGNFINGIAGKLAGVKYRIGGIRNSFLEKYKFLPQKLIHNYLLQGSISNSLAGKITHVEAGQNKAPVFHIPNCYPLNTSILTRPVSQSIKIISVGRFVQQKNYELALASVLKCKTYLLEKNIDLTITYDIVGYGELEAEVRQMVTSMRLDDIVQIIINPPNINSYYEAADIYLCSSSFEGLSNSIMEAMSFSLPIVATNVGGNPELVDDNINGYITEETTDALSQKLIHLVENSEIRHKFGIESYNKIKDYFSVQAFYDRYDALIENDFKPLN